MERWCPLSHTDCRDGYVKESELLCAYWDSIDNRCAMTAVAFMQVGRLREGEADDENNYVE